MKTIYLISSIVFSTALIGCASSRGITEFNTATGILKCAEPPPDVIATGAKANVEALVPKINTNVKANVSASTTVSRIRSEVPNLQAVEALEYRMCLAYGNGIVDSESYKKFMNNILPMLQGIDDKDNLKPNKEKPASNQTVKIEEHRSYSGVAGCDTARSKKTAVSACKEGANTYVSRNNLKLVSVKLSNFAHDIKRNKEPWPSNARSCKANVIANCEIVVKK